MCTVTYVPLQDGFCITSNRDEQVTRARAIPPKEYNLNNKKITFPKDSKAGGTWFAKSEEATIVLLNGANEKHNIKPPYRKSRGLIVLDLISSEKIIEKWKNIDLENIEPFTIVLFYNESLYQLQWNEVEKSITNLDINQNHIWSSSTLYSKKIREKRAKWFFEFLKKNKNITAKELLNFHQFTEKSNKDFGLQINRNNSLKTISITQSVNINNNTKIQYIDLLTNE
ncbi:MAG: NRDE family protein [Flavobacterium sp.]|nr:NRDE family protein [Flavobacterium sp.]